MATDKRDQDLKDEVFRALDLAQEAHQLRERALGRLKRAIAECNDPGFDECEIVIMNGYLMLSKRIEI